MVAQRHAVETYLNGGNWELVKEFSEVETGKKKDTADACVFHSIREDQLVDPVLDYLFTFFTDERAFNAAVARALPDASELEALKRERDAAAKSLSRVEKEIERLVDAVTQGADPSLLIAKRQELKARREHEYTRLDGLAQRLDAMPGREAIQREALGIRLHLLRNVQERDWRKLPFDEIKQFLIFLFGENPGKSGVGIRLMQDCGRWQIAFQGRASFHHELVNGRPVSHAMQAEAQRHNKQVERELKKFVNLKQKT